MGRGVGSRGWRCDAFSRWPERGLDRIVSVSQTSSSCPSWPRRASTTRGRWRPCLDSARSRMVSVFCPVEDEADQGLGQAGFHRAHHLHRSLRSVHEYQPAPEVHLPTRGLRPGVLPVLRVRRRVPDLPRGQGHQQLQGAVRGGGRGQIPLRALAAGAWPQGPLRLRPRSYFPFSCRRATAAALSRCRATTARWSRSDSPASAARTDARSAARSALPGSTTSWTGCPRRRVSTSPRGAWPGGFPGTAFGGEAIRVRCQYCASPGRYNPAR